MSRGEAENQPFGEKAFDVVTNARGSDSHRWVKMITILFPGTEGAERYDSFINGKFEFWVFTLNKKSQ